MEVSGATAARRWGQSLNTHAGIGGGIGCCNSALVGTEGKAVNGSIKQRRKTVGCAGALAPGGTQGGIGGCAGSQELLCIIWSRIKE